MEIGARSKVVAANRMNARSSRSHTLFQVTVKRTVRPARPSLQLPDILLKVPDMGEQIRDTLLESAPFSPGADAGTMARVLSAQLTFVDLAGSERTSKTKSGA